jgi:hypothetical protein
MDRRKRTWKNLAESALVLPTQPGTQSEDVEYVDEIEFNYRKEAARSARLGGPEGALPMGTLSGAESTRCWSRDGPIGTSSTR